MESLLDLLDAPLDVDLEESEAVKAAVKFLTNIGRLAELEAWRLEHRELAPTSVVPPLWRGGLEEFEDESAAAERLRPTPDDYAAQLDRLGLDPTFGDDAEGCWVRAVRDAARKLADEFDREAAEAYFRERLNEEIPKLDAEPWVREALDRRPAAE